MKKMYGKILAVITSALILFSLSACGEEESVNSAIAVSERYIATANEESMNNFESFYAFYDETYYYYMFYIGHVRRVPLQDNASVYEYSGNPFNKEFTTKQVDEKTVAHMVSTVQSECVQNSVGGELAASIEKEFAVLKLDVGLKVKYENTSSKTTTQTSSFENATKYSEEESETTAFAFGDWSKHGYYRYILLGDMEVFGTLIMNKQTGEYTTDTYEILVSQYYALDYSTRSTFNDHEKSSLTFTLTQEEISNLPVPEIDISNVDEELGDDAVSEIPDKKQVIYDPDYKKQMVLDTGFIYDKFDISELSDCMTNSYNFEFEISVLISEKDKGYQEIHLYNGNGTWVAGTSSYEHGGSALTKVSYYADFFWTVSGEKCTDEMKLGYTAHGAGADVWYKEDLRVKVTAKLK